MCGASKHFVVLAIFGQWVHKFPYYFLAFLDLGVCYFFVCRLLLFYGRFLFAFPPAPSIVRVWNICKYFVDGKMALLLGHINRREFWILNVLAECFPHSFPKKKWQSQASRSSSNFHPMWAQVLRGRKRKWSMVRGKSPSYARQAPQGKASGLWCWPCGDLLLQPMPKRVFELHISWASSEEMHWRTKQPSANLSGAHHCFRRIKQHGSQWKSRNRLSCSWNFRQ